MNFITGLGKSGLIGRLIAATYTSVGFPMQFIDPVNALHGDVGIFKTSPKGILYCISKSGKTKEVWDLINYLQQLHPSLEIVLVTFEWQKERTDIYQVVLPKVKELDPHDIIPSYSLIEVQKWFYQQLEKHCNKDLTYLSTFKKNHPGGSIGSC